MPISFYAAGVSVLLLLWCLQRRATKLGSHGFAIPFLVVMAIWFGWLGWQKHGIERAATRAVRAVTGEADLKVVCRSWLNFADTHAGFVKSDSAGVAANSAALSRDTCEALGTWLASGRSRPSDAQVAAVGVLAHEAGHLREGGQFHEATVECWGAQHVEEFAFEMGASAEQAWALAQRYWQAVHPRLNERYRTPQCAENEAMDATPGDNHWP